MTAQSGVTSLPAFRIRTSKLSIVRSFTARRQECYRQDRESDLHSEAKEGFIYSAWCWTIIPRLVSGTTISQTRRLGKDSVAVCDRRFHPRCYDVGDAGLAPSPSKLYRP